MSAPRGRKRGNPNIAEAGRKFRFQVGNPGGPGRPKSEREIVEFCRINSMDAAKQYVATLHDENAKVAERLLAATAILDRAYGKPRQVAEHTFRGELRDLSNDELLAIICGSGVAAEETSEGEPGSVH